MKSVFNLNDAQELTARINSLSSKSAAIWGKMNIAQMLAHCNVSYEMVFENKHPKPNVIMRFILKSFVKKIVVGDKPYKRSSQTAPAFIITDTRDFENEKNRLISYVIKTQKLGAAYFEGKESLSFGVLNKTEWNNMFYKHLDHHLNQFGA
jgi:hypothetical protein